MRGVTKVKINDKYDNGREIFYSVELEKDVFVDVKCVDNLYYVMDCADGHRAYNRDGNSFDYYFNEKDVIEFVMRKANIVKHEAKVHILASEVERINKLLAIDSLEEMTDSELIEQGANTDVCEGIFYVEFDNGASINFDLCSGSHNYWDDVVWTNADKTRDIVFDCEYELDDIEIEIDSELYIVKIVKE